MPKCVRRLTIALAFVLAACVTVNIYFPAAAIQKAADQIVEDVRGTPSKEKQDNKEGAQDSFFDGFRRLGIGPSNAYAEINIEVSTPAIRNLRQAMKNRFPGLKPFYDKGSIGENNVGLLQIRDTAALNLKEKADVARLVDQENQDRRSLYSEIVKANNLKPESLPQVQKLFANSWRSKSQPNWWIQNDSNAWERKK
ncbi:MAG: hypothetical protein A4E65_02528 [Syntrophorhabdus sp. PtaU1.Bin153]|nr:MAG: hypothetical protein A4E65_02528 [Syntrophorhabdus sp. PtaU1.Bin153]